MHPGRPEDAGEAKECAGREKVACTPTACRTSPPKKGSSGRHRANETAEATIWSPSPTRQERTWAVKGRDGFVLKLNPTGSKWCFSNFSLAFFFAKIRGKRPLILVADRPSMIPCKVNFLHLLGPHLMAPHLMASHLMGPH